MEWNNILTLLASIVTFITALLALIKGWIELRKIKQEISQIKIVANTSEMRDALKMPLEGLWSVSGEFTKYQGVYELHLSTGYANFIWDDHLNRYNVVYSYSVEKNYTYDKIVTAICSGYTFYENKKETSISLIMKIDAFTCKVLLPRSQQFTMTTKNDVVIGKELKEITFLFETSQTKGEIKFLR